MGKLTNLALSLVLGTMAAAAWAADGTSISWNDSAWKSNGSGQKVQYAASNLQTESLPSTVMRPVVTQDNQSGSNSSAWAAEEPAPLEGNNSGFLSPETITPNTEDMNLPNQINLPDNTVIQLDNPSGVPVPAETAPAQMVPATEIPAMKKTQTSSANANKTNAGGVSAAPSSAASKANAKTSQPVPVTPFNPQLAEPVIPGADESYKKLTENLIDTNKDKLIKTDGKKVELKKSETRIDRSGNVGAFYTNAVRTEDGRLLGNPYSHGIHEYHPRCFQPNGVYNVRIRTVPPAAAYGEDGYGNPAFNCCGGMYSTNCGLGCDTDCTLDCGADCGTGCGIDCGTGCGVGCGTDCGTGCDAGYCDPCGLDCSDCGSCCDPCGSSCGCNPCFACCPALGWFLKNAEFEAGVMAYRDSLGIGKENNFGYDLGLNWSTPTELCFGLAAQTGGRFMQSGKEEYVNVTDQDRVKMESKNPSQFFWTTGLFYRNPMSRWTLGAAYDALRTESCWNYTLGQVRTELAYRLWDSTDIGFRGAFAMDERVMNFWIDENEYKNKLTVNSYYTGFLRHWFSTGTEGVIYGGVTEENEGLIGGYLEVPVTNHSSLRNSFTYVVPNTSKKSVEDDIWSVNITWVVYFGGNSKEGMVNPLRPLFEVADNTTFLQRMKVE